MASHSYDQFDDYEEPDGEALAAGNRSLEELQRLSAFQQVTTKVPPSYDGRSSWFAFEDAVDDWCDITELEPEKRGPALRNRLEGEAAIYKRLLDREALKNKEDGVRYFKRFLRPYFVKGAANVFLYRFQQFMNMHRGSGDMLRWMTRFQLSYQRMNESWMDTFVPLVSENDPVVRAYVLRLPQEEQQAITPEEALRRVNEQGRETHGRALPITANLIALLFVTLSDLTQDQRQVLTSLMAHKNRALTDYRVDELRTVYLEVFCTTKTTVDNPLLAPTSAPGRKSFIVIDEGTLDESQGYWCEDEDDGAEGFLDAFEDCFWVYDDESYTWFQRKFQGRKLRRGKGKGKGRKGKGKGHGGRRFFKRKKGKAHAAEDVSASDWAWNEEWHDWSYEAWTATDWQEGADDSYAAKGRKGKGKGKGKFFKGKDKKGKDGKGDHANATSEAQRTAALAGPGTPAIANAFWVQHHSFVSEAVYKQDSNEEDVPKSFLTHALSPTSMVLDIGCTRAMTSRQAAKEFMGFVDHHPDCGLWYELRPTNSHFSFANSEMAQCKEKIVIFMYDLSYTIQSTEFDIVDQGTVPFLMSLPQMRNLRFKISLEPDEALLSSSVLGMKNLPLKVARSSHLMLDLIDVAWHMWGVRFDAHKKVSFFMTNEHHFEYGYKLVTKECSPPGEESSEALVVEDEWHLDEGNHRLIRVHRKERVQSFAPSKGNTPIPLEYLDTIRETTINYKDGMKETQNDEWKDKPPVKFPKPWLGRTVFKILPGGIENRTSVKVSTRGKGELFGDEDEDPFPELKGKGVETTKWDDQYSPSEAPVEQPEPSPESKEDNAPEERFDPEPRRIALPLPGQEVARSSPAFRRMIEKLRSDVELYKLHVKHYHMSSAQFRRRTSMLGLPEEIYEKYDRQDQSGVATHCYASTSRGKTGPGPSKRPGSPSHALRWSYVKGDKVLVWMKDESKIKSEGVWVRGKVMGQEGAMVIVHVHQAILRVNQSKIRRDHDPWHDVHIPLDMDKVPGGSPPGEEPGGLFCEYEPQCCAEHEICYHTHGGRFCDVLEIAPGPTGITACMARHGNRIGEPVHVESWQPKAIQQSIASAWKTLLHASPTLVVINPTIPDSLVRNKKAIKTYWHFCAEVVRWQDQNQGEVAVVGLTDQGFFTSQAARSLHWRIGMSSICFGQDEGATLMTNLGLRAIEGLAPGTELEVNTSTTQEKERSRRVPGLYRSVPGYQDYHDTPVPGDMSWDEGEEEIQGGPSGPGPDGPPDGAAIPIDVDGDDGGNPPGQGAFPPGGGPPGPGPGFGPSPEDFEDGGTPMEVHMEPPPPGPPPEPAHPIPASAAPKLRFPVYPNKIPEAAVPLPGQPLPEKKGDPQVSAPFPDEDETDPTASSSQPSGPPGLPVAEGEFPIQQTPVAPPATDAPVPDSDSDDSQATRDYGESSLASLVEGEEDVLLVLPHDLSPPQWAVFDGDAFASWLTKQDKIKAGTITQDMQRKYAKEIRAAKLDEFKSYLDNDALRFVDRRKLAKDVNFLTGRWVLTVKVDKNGFFSKFKARWVCRGFQDKNAWDQQTDSPTATRYGFRLVCQCAANNFWDLFHLDLKTAFLQGEHYNLQHRSVIVQLPPDIGLPPWMVGLCLRPVYGLNDAPRRWWNRLDKFLRTIGLQPTRADRCTYVGYEGVEKQKSAAKIAEEVSLFQEGCSPLGEEPPIGDLPGIITESPLAALLSACEEPPSSPDTAVERSYLAYPDIAQAFKTKHLVEYDWRPVTDKTLLDFLGGVAHKKRGWFPFENGQALVSHRAKALRGPEPTYKIKDYPYRVSIILRQGTWWVIEKAQDLRNKNEPSYLEEEAEVLVTLFLPERAAYKTTEQLPQLTPELVDQLLEHFVDPVHGSPSKHRKSVGVLSLHVDDLIIAGTPSFLKWFLARVKEHFTIGHEDKNDLMFTGQRVRWVVDDKGSKKYISIDQKLSVSELEEIVIPKHLKDTDVCDKQLHTSYRSLLGSINWLQSRTQFQACYSFSRLASASAAPTVGHCKELNKLCRQIRSEEVELRIWPVQGTPRILGIPDAAFRNNSDKSSQRAMTVFIADQRVKNRRDTRGSLIFFESTKIKRTTLSTTVAELYALMKCFGTCQMLRGLWKDISGLDAEIHMRTDANNLVTTASTTHAPEQQETIHMIQMLRKEACSGAIADLSHVRTEHCLADCLTKRSAKSTNLVQSVQKGWLKEIDAHPPFRSLLEHKAFLSAWLRKELSGFQFCSKVCFMISSCEKKD
ncbi:RE1 [Symbiodinium natans]|uniref:RE1 protein n=1 Tax=Symbiodinium natans TaxID=878477 RepID=A0A812RNE3_9DINO|nr:RE1 [Symbiodinium natans]